MAEQMAEGRFASLGQDDRDYIMENIETKNTKRQNTTAVKLFREYLTEKSKPIEFEQYTIEQMDDSLASFYLEMRNKEGKHYKKTTMQAYRQGLNRHLQKCRDIDICNEEIFKKSCKSFKGMTKELKRLGLAAIEHHPSIEESDIEKMYSYFCKNLEDAQLLQYKVFVDIMLHFGRRGRENLSSLTRKHFAVKRGADDKLYVYKVIDEQTKNHQSDSELSSDGRMYEITDGERCPVKSFVKYIRRLNPKCVKLFQQARSYPKEGVYYDNIPLGHNRLGQFMNEISKMANLSHIYTNHSCRATTIHLLDEADIPSRHIMTVTGHKSETSLKTYSGKTCEKKKRHMSEILSSKTCGKKSCISNIDFLCLSQSTITVEANEGVENIPVELSDANFDLELLSNSQNETVMNDILPNNQLDEILTEIDNGPSNTNIMKPETLKTNQNFLNLPQPDMKMPFLNNCNNVTVNINYNVHPYVNNPAKV
ncbi:uncharacterized protein [Mytilus edulis]|uniref:uncharacterized protein n=1 Tax=Mytilus edulis TaxID=6550 RepID=UPI0039F14361